MIKLVRAEYKTGISLAEDYTVYNKGRIGDDVVSTVFDDLSSAISYIEQQKPLYLNIEFHVYSDDTHIYYDTTILDV